MLDPCLMDWFRYWIYIQSIFDVFDIFDMYICKRGHLWPKLCKDLDINMRCTSKSLQYKTQHNDTKKAIMRETSLYHVETMSKAMRESQSTSLSKRNQGFWIPNHYSLSGKQKKTHHYSSDLSKATRSNIVILMLLNDSTTSHLGFRLLWLVSLSLPLEVDESVGECLAKFSYIDYEQC